MILKKTEKSRNKPRIQFQIVIISMTKSNRMLSKPMRHVVIQTGPS